jgi:hypothetical protein
MKDNLEDLGTREKIILKLPYTSSRGLDHIDWGRGRIYDLSE